MSKSKKLREEISAQSSKIQSINNVYHTKLYSFNTRINNLSQKARITSRGILQKTREKHIGYVEELEQLTLEREQLKTSYRKVIESEKQKLRDLRAEYKDNRTTFKEEDKKERQEKISDFKDSLYFNKGKIIAILAVIVVIFLTVILGIVGDNAKKAKEDEERKRNYFINIDDDFTFDCNLREAHDSSYVACQSRSLSGNFSAYDTVKLIYADTSGNDFIYKDDYVIVKTLYEKDSFDINQLGDSLEHSINLYIYNTVLKENVYGKEIKIHYKVNDSDKALIQSKFESWKQWKAEEAEKATKAEADRKAKEEQEAAERAAAEQREKEARTSYKVKIINEGEDCPSNAEYCYISGSSSGYSEYGYGTVKGKIINNKGRDLSYIQVVMGVYDSSGAKIGDCLDNLSGLKSGATWSFEAYCTGWAKNGRLDDLDITGW